jgi:hypothetical protein
VNDKKAQVVCGNVNAKNSAGQLAGPSPFVFLGESRESWLARNYDILKDGPKTRIPERGFTSSIARSTSGASCVTQRRREYDQVLKTVIARNVRMMRNKPAVRRRKKIERRLLRSFYQCVRLLLYLRKKRNYPIFRDQG